MITRRQLALSAAARAFAAVARVVKRDDIPGALRNSIERVTADRLARGEDEHLAYYILQSNAFTRRPRIEPALSAKEAKSRTPDAVIARMRDFLGSLRVPAPDPRLAWWQENLPGSRRTLKGLEAAYREAMRFLFEKEFSGRGTEIYRTRGHSSDTSLAACFTVWTALGVLRGLAPGTRIERALIAGPGLDFAPRTGLRDEVPPQSYQPWLAARALLEWKLADPGRLSVDCVDINPRVVRFVERNPGELALPPEAGGAEFSAYLRALGPRVNAPAARVTAVRLNLLTERFDPPLQYELAIATNVLVYLNRMELELAIANLHAMLKPGGWLIHNEPRPELEEIASALRMPPVHGRTIEIARGARAPLLDAFAIHRKN